ncbi:MAG: hypothetical protein NZM43_07965 [Saprospiraceae bacterium]|nr:hypothetical protein [Saprospiraceae bacterium]MDW8484243.1 hypothetical protein [Saprospiraceae bacterium]
MYDLNQLVHHRKDILLAEVVGWLHDYRKCSDDFLNSQARQGPGLPRNELGKKYQNLQELKVNLLHEEGPILKLLNNRSEASPVLGGYLSRAHNTAHFDKQEPVGGEQGYPNAFLSTPFGFERNVPTNLTEELWKLPWANLHDRENTHKSVEQLFSQTVADTRRPINEVDLWSWGVLVGALYKAALARVVLSNNAPEANSLRWRLLSIRLDGLSYLLQVEKVPDLLARMELLSNGLNEVRTLLEVKYPIASEVYRDENGSIYVAPDLEDLLNQANANGKTLASCILDAFAASTIKGDPNLQIGSELAPQVYLEQKPWWGQDPEWSSKKKDTKQSCTEQDLKQPSDDQATEQSPVLKDELPDIIGILSSRATSSLDVEKISAYWQQGKAPAEVCSVCGLRPQGPGQKALERRVCDICEKRRTDRAKEWVIQKQQQTIWLDEVADKNGRVALITGRFDLQHWLSGRLVETLLLIAPADAQNTKNEPATPKTPSFSRLRRIWETTRRFWQEVSAEIQNKQQSQHPRLRIRGSFIPKDGKLSLLPYHAYEVVRGRLKMSVLWEGSAFISCDNLTYLSSGEQLGQPVIAFLKEVSTVSVHTPSEYGTGSQPIGTFQSLSIEEIGYYAPVIPILAEPNAFMMLVPASEAINIVSAIRGKYECEMGKVRNRLPVHLGAIFANRRAPLRAILDAGRAMLERSNEAEMRGWSIQKKTIQTDEEGQLAKIAEIHLERKGRKLCWRVPLLMGDGKTKDLWYPYAFLDTDAEPVDRSRRVKAHNPWTKQEGYLIHVDDLKEGDPIYFTPATFDFEFLDTNARRFEVYYNSQGRRLSRPTRPFYLDELTDAARIWSCLQNLSRRQRHLVIHSIEATRQLWYGHDKPIEDDATFRRFAADTLANAEWPKRTSWKNMDTQEKELLIHASCSGLLADVGELYMEILKQ